MLAIHRTVQSANQNQKVKNITKIIMPKDQFDGIFVTYVLRKLNQNAIIQSITILILNNINALYVTDCMHIELLVVFIC